MEIATTNNLMEILSLWNRFSTLHSQFFNQYLRVRISIFMENKILVWYVSWYVLTTGERKLLNYSGGKEDINSPQFCSFQLFFSVKAPKRAVLRAKQMDKCLFIMLPLGYLLSFCIHPSDSVLLLWLQCPWLVSCGPVLILSGMKVD